MAIAKDSFHVHGDTLRVHHTGAMTVELIDALERSAAELVAEHGHFFLLCEISGLEGIHPAARQRVADWARRQPSAGVAVVGGSLLVRTLMLLLARAVAMVTGQKVVTAFFKTEDEALAWIADRRIGLASP